MPLLIIRSFEIRNMPFRENHHARYTPLVQSQNKPIIHQGNKEQKGLHQFNLKLTGHSHNICQSYLQQKHKLEYSLFWEILIGSPILFEKLFPSITNTKYLVHGKGIISCSAQQNSVIILETQSISHEIRQCLPG